MPVGGSRKLKKKNSTSSTPKIVLTGIVETDSEAESWEEVPDFETPKQPDADMTSGSETELVRVNQSELDAAQYLTTLYNQLLMNQGVSPETAFNMMLEQMQDDAQLSMLYKWDQMGRTTR